MSSTFDLDVYLDLNSDAFAPATPPPATTTAAASQASYSSQSATAPAVPSPSPSPMSRPATTAASATPEFPAPSHPYNMHPQQTMPLMDLYGDMGMLGLENDAATLQSTPFSFFDHALSMQPQQQHSPAMSDTSMGLNSISPLMTTANMVKPETSQAPSTASVLPVLHGEDRKMYRGIHSQMAQQKMQQQQAARVAPMMHADPKDAQISHIFNSLRAQPIHRPPPNTLPLVDKLKKEEAEMDDDERLLASEEGKKLSSKERRQLRNKVSARAFRSRRKEYINQLEAEVNRKTAEAQALADKVEELRISNERFEAFMRTLLRTQHFNNFLNEMTSTGAQISDILKAIPQVVPQQAAPQQQQAPPAPADVPKFVNPNQPEEWPLGYPTWASQGMPQVYQVAIPEPPSIAELDLKVDGGFDDDLLVSDGFYPTIRNEKADIDYTRIHEDEDYEIAEATYNPPELLSDVIMAEEQRQKAQSKPDLDSLFPGVGVNSLLERLEKVAGGEARPEDLFEGVAKKDSANNPADGNAQKQGATIERPSTPTLCRSNNMISRAEGVYRRIGLMVE